MFNRSQKLFFTLGILWLFFVCLFIGNYAWAQDNSEKSYYYQSIEIDIKINQDSTFDVIEKQTYNLTGSFGYFYRDIELKDLDHISDIEVFDGEGRKLNEDEYDLSYKGNRRHIQWNFPRRNFINKDKSWAVKYKVHGGLGFYDNYDEIYWNAVFADRDVDVKNVNVIVDFPVELKENQIVQKLFVGELGSKAESYNYEILDSRTVRFWGNNVKPGEFFTIVAAWPKGIIIEPSFERNQIINWIILLFGIALPIFIFTRSFRIWKEKGKDPEIRKTVIAQYEPPEDLPPAVVGILIDQKFDIREVTGTMIDLAVNGYLRIKEGKKSFFTGQQYSFEKLKEWPDLKLFEQEILSGIFKKGDIVSSSDLKNKYYKLLSGIKKELHQETARTNYLNGNIQTIRNKYILPYIIMLILALFAGFLAGIIANNSIGFLGVWLILISISLFISSIIGLLFGYYMPALTPQGSEEKWKWLGFKEYLQTAERFRLGAETAETFSKYLPYAIVFGVEKKWAERFADLKYQAPHWYTPAVIRYSSGQPSGIPSFSGLTSSISSFTSSISKTFASTPGGSGVGGAGGAGGGGGGGGGGAG